MTLKKATAQGDSTLLAQVLNVFAKHVDAKREYLLGAALWALHTHIYTRYDKSPRLAILSPVKDCGKSTVLNILGAMTWNPKRVSDPSVASTFRLAGSHTLLMDEVDNMAIIRSMKSVLNDGHSVDGCVPRTINGEVISYPVYGPVALAAIGKLPVPLMSRSIVINMDRSDKAMVRFSVQEHHYASQLASWAKQANLNTDPQMPAQIIGRDADKWRPLIAIADSFDRGDIARDVALKILAESNMLDIKESVLRDTQKVFYSVKADILTVDALYQGLLEDKEGEHEVDYGDMKMTKRKVGDILADF